jgi:hypothetical protein
MPSLTVPLQDKFEERLEKFTWVNWSAVIKQELLEKEKQRELFEALVSKSKLSSKDAKELADKVNEGMLKALKKKFPSLL